MAKARKLKRREPGEASMPESSGFEPHDGCAFGILLMAKFDTRGDHQFSRLHGEVATIVDIDFQKSRRFGSGPNWIALSRQWSRGVELKVYCNINSI